MIPVDEGITGKLHINYLEDDALIHCTDNPGRITYLRISVQQKRKQKESLSFQEAYVSCIQDLVIACKVVVYECSYFVDCSYLSTLC